MIHNFLKKEISVDMVKFAIKYFHISSFFILLNKSKNISYSRTYIFRLGFRMWIWVDQDGSAIHDSDCVTFQVELS